jgi:hypothetical protein
MAPHPHRRPDCPGQGPHMSCAGQRFLDGPALAAALGRSPQTIRHWATAGHLTRHGRNRHGTLYDLDQALRHATRPHTNQPETAADATVGTHDASRTTMSTRIPRGVDPRSTTARGYGAGHQQLRREWAPRVDAGDVTCRRCQQPIHPGEPWDLGHHDQNRDTYTGPEHRSCNRATAGRHQPSPASRDW